MRLRVVLLAGVIAFQPAIADDAPAPLQISNSYIQYRTMDGSEYKPSTIIPYAVDKSCYNWVVEFEPGFGSVEIEEELTLPSKGNWDSSADVQIKVAPDKSSAITKRSIDLARGTASYGWCVVKGDPKGRYQYTLRAGSTVLAMLPFELVSTKR